MKDKCVKLAAEDESKAFFQKMIGDYYRYVAESATEATLEEVKQGALSGYEEADKLSKGLNACNPIRLGLALNFSVFHYEVMNDHKKACELGEQALSEAEMAMIQAATSKSGPCGSVKISEGELPPIQDVLTQAMQLFESRL